MERELETLVASYGLKTVVIRLAAVCRTKAEEAIRQGDSHMHRCWTSAANTLIDTLLSIPNL